MAHDQQQNTGRVQKGRLHELAITILQIDFAGGI